MPLKDHRILVGVSGGIAAYKTCALVSKLIEHGAEVKVVMTEEATRFVTPMSFQALSGNPVALDGQEHLALHAMDHIELARWAEAMMIVPCTANTIAKLAQGFADNLLTSLTLVCESPLICAPSMNPSMWKHKAVQRNVAQLKKDGAVIVGPESGRTACGEQGEGRLVEQTELIQALESVL